MLYLQLIWWSLIFPMLRHGSFAIWICTRWYLINIDADISRRINNSIKTNNTYCHRHVRKHQAILPSRSIPTTSKSSSVSHQYCWHSIMNLPKQNQLSLSTTLSDYLPTWWHRFVEPNANSPQNEPYYLMSFFFSWTFLEFVEKWWKKLSNYKQNPFSAKNSAIWQSV